MLSLLFTIVLILVQALFCHGLGCGPGGSVDPAPVAHHVHVPAEDPAQLQDTLAGLGKVAIGLAFSGVVEVGGGPAAAAPLRGLDC